MLEHGFGAALGGMSVVFAALLLITLFIAMLPRVLHAVWPLPDEDDQPPSSKAKPTSTEDELVAAIAFALHTELQRKGP